METAHAGEKQPTRESQSERKDLLREKIEKAQTAEHIDLEEARQAVEAHTDRAKKPAHAPEEQTTSAGWWSKELGSQTFEKTLSSVRRKLNPAEKQFSRIIHNQAVEKTSDLAAKTVARPTGILFGGIFAFLGSSAAYLLARHLGGELRLGIFAATFLGGYLAGLLVELAIRAVRIKRHKA